MNDILARSADFLMGHLPTGQLLAWWALPALAWAWLCLRLAGHLKTRRGWPTGCTRKVFHFLIFGTVVAIQATAGTRAVCLFGLATSVVVFAAIARGEGYLTLREV